MIDAVPDAEFARENRADRRSSREKQMASEMIEPQVPVQGDCHQARRIAHDVSHHVGPEVPALLEKEQAKQQTQGAGKQHAARTLMSVRQRKEDRGQQDGSESRRHRVSQQLCSLRNEIAAVDDFLGNSGGYPDRRQKRQQRAPVATQVVKPAQVARSRGEVLDDGAQQKTTQQYQPDSRGSTEYDGMPPSARWPQSQLGDGRPWFEPNHHDRQYRANRNSPVRRDERNVEGRKGYEYQPCEVPVHCRSQGLKAQRQAEQVPLAALHRPGQTPNGRCSLGIRQ
ncbi:hypothetical protein SAMN02787076_03498 [Rhizobacter sp. OV335]|nr:hypothetical protein SAMN02787076_03498 [Rhizobacter sp. OV335]